MPVEGLPLALENFLSSVLCQSSLSSFKIAAHSFQTTVVLRFNNGGEENQGPVYGRQSPPASFKKKSPSQIRRDQKRSESFHSSLNTAMHSSSKSGSPSSYINVNTCDKMEVKSNSPYLPRHDPPQPTNQGTSLCQQSVPVEPTCVPDTTTQPLGQPDQTNDTSPRRTTDTTEHGGVNHSVTQNTPCPHEGISEAVTAHGCESTTSSGSELSGNKDSVSAPSLIRYVQGLSQETITNILDSSRNCDIRRIVSKQPSGNSHGQQSFLVETDDVVLEMDSPEFAVRKYFAKSSTTERDIVRYRQFLACPEILKETSRDNKTLCALQSFMLYMRMAYLTRPLRSV